MEQGSLKKHHRLNRNHPAIFAVQHFCLHDGPGVRSIVFFKGCPLRCEWCQNPESWKTSPEVSFKAHLCIACNTCVDACPQKAISAPGIRDISACDLCFTCVDQCPSGAMVRFGDDYAVDAVMDALRPEFPYMQNTRGGVTFSGGEPMLFPEYLVELSVQLHEQEIHTTLETCGYFSPDLDLRFLSDIDLVLFDIKLYDDGLHRKFCGTSNAIIKQNLKQLAAQASEKTGPPVWPRLPLIPTVTDTADNLTAWADFLKDIRLSFLTLVPYHNLGASKRQWLNLPSAPNYPAMTDERLQKAKLLLEDRGITCFAPGEEAWERAGLLNSNFNSKN